MGKMYKAKEIMIPTNLNPIDVIEIVRKYIEVNKFPYIIISTIDNILYDDSFYLVHKPVWFIRVKHKDLVEGLVEQIEEVVVMDQEGVVKYIINDHGVVFNL